MMSAPSPKTLSLRASRSMDSAYVSSVYQWRPIRFNSRFDPDCSGACRCGATRALSETMTSNRRSSTSVASSEDKRKRTRGTSTTSRSIRTPRDESMSAPNEPMCVPVITISEWCSANAVASRTIPAGSRLRLTPRAMVVAQKVQCSSHPSCTRSNARALCCRAGMASADTPSASAMAPRSAPATTCSTEGSAPIIARLAGSADAHPITALRNRGFRARARRTALRRSRSASDVTAQELKIARSASQTSSTISWPPSMTIARTRSLSYWFARQPNVRRCTFIGSHSDDRGVRSALVDAHDGRRRPHRKREVERAPAPFLALHPDAPAVGLDDELAERQAEPRAADARDVGCPDLLELPEDQLVVLRRNAWAIVRHGEEHSITIFSHREVQRHGVRGMRQGILDQIADHALDERAVGVEHRGVISDVDGRRRAVLLEAVLPLVHDLGEQRSRRERIEVEGQCGLLDAADLEQVLDQREQIFRLGLGIPERLLLVGRELA